MNILKSLFIGLILVGSAGAFALPSGGGAGGLGASILIEQLK